MVFLLSGVVSAATTSRMTEGESQSPLGHTAKRVVSRNLLVFVGTYALLLTRNRLTQILRSSSCSSWQAFRERLVLVSRLIYYFNIVLVSPYQDHQEIRYRARFVQFVCGNVVPQPISARATLRRSIDSGYNTIQKGDGRNHPSTRRQIRNPKTRYNNIRATGARAIIWQDRRAIVRFAPIAPDAPIWRYKAYRENGL